MEKLTFEIVEREKKDMADVDIYAKQTYREYKEWNSAIEHIAKMIGGE